MAIGPFGSSKIWLLGAHLRITDIGARSISRLPPTISRRVFQPRGDPVCSCIIGCDSYRRGFRYLAIPLSVWGRLKRALQDNRFGAVPALLGLSALPLALQWYLLPGASLAHYRVPGIILFIWQAGNLAFLVCYIQGLKSFAESEDRQLRPFVHGSLILGVLAVAALSASYFLAHTNWMIRLLYYWIPFAAPVSLLGFRQLFLKFKLLGYAAGLSFILASLSHTVRYGVP